MTPWKQGPRRTRLAAGLQNQFPHSGSVRLIPMGTPNFSIDATTFSGDVRSDFPLTLQGGSQSLARGFQGRRQNQSVRGTVGSGGAMITMQSFSGNIVIAKP